MIRQQETSDVILFSCLKFAKLYNKMIMRRVDNMDIKPRYDHTAFGNFMFNLCAKTTKFLLKHR